MMQRQIHRQCLVRRKGLDIEKSSCHQKKILSALERPAVWLTLALVLNILEGALRKWVPGFESGPGRALAYFSKDLCLGFGAILLINSRRARPIAALKSAEAWAVPALIAVLVGGVISLTHGFNAVGTVLSLRALVILPVLGYLYLARAGRFPLLSFAIIGVMLTLLNAPLALVQNSLPSSHVLNQYAADEMNIVEVAYGVRATGTFAYITGLGVLSALGVWAGMVVISLGRGWKVQVLGALGILAGFGCAFASISRGTVVTAVAMLGLWALSSARAGSAVLKGLWLAGVVGLLTILLLPNLGERFLYVGEGAIDRFESAGDDNMHRALGQFGEMWHAVTVHPLGKGPGTEQVGGNAVSKGVAGFTSYESQFPRIVAEFGLLGLLGFFGLLGTVIFSLQRAKRSGGPRWTLAVTATQIYVLGQFYGNVVFNHTGSAAVWLIVTAVLAATPSLRRRKKKKPRRYRKLSSAQAELEVTGPSA